MTNSYPSGSAGMPTGPLGAPGRRSSYASVVSGATSSQNLPRSGAFSHLLNQHPADYSYDPSYQNVGGHSRHDSRGYEVDTNGGRGAAGSWGRSAQLPSFSSAFGALAGGWGTPEDLFVTPSYLKSSKYVQRLRQAHHAKLAAHRDGPSASSSQPGSLSTSASSVNLHAKMTPSHRGMTYDLIEKAPPLEEESLSPLPTKWNPHDKYGGLEVLSDGQEVKFTGPKSTSDRDHEACAIRADYPMPPQCGIFYYEVTIVSRKREESSIGIGFSSKSVPLSRLPGWEPESWAYHGDDGCSFGCQSSGKSYGPPFTAGDVVGCGINFRTGSAFFTKNGDHLGTAFRDIKGKLYPSVGMKKSGEHIRVNFGQSPFVFDIDGMMAHEKSQIQHDISETSTSRLAPPLSETDLIQQLVLQFLQHDGYIETARAFAEEVHAEKQALNLDPNTVVESFNVKEDEDAGHRQRIRTALLDGDVDKALKYTNAYYPHVLKDNDHVYFRLRVRKFVEMIRQGAEIHNATSMNGTKKSNGHADNWYDDNINQEMELDDHTTQNNNWDKMDTGEPSDSLKYLNLMNETIEYGRVLQAEFKDDQRREVSKALEDAFALMAYPDPTNAKEVAHLLDPSGRVAVAEELNSAILLSLGKSSTAALEQLYQQTTVLLEDLAEGGAAGAFVNIDDYTRPASLAQK
ncbi:hypothetical protein BP5796_11045 [Coleophoma crateriformis]|uniref:Uncharacterized protein n=1 Tax=Coleophoma crateriformis TaxID=565419 RepID=A0A3D8QLP0_9HELO|nr:hypothetical protein BP5796_11045 [Coleophoma crateriformis]